MSVRTIGKSGSLMEVAAGERGAWEARAGREAAQIVGSRPIRATGRGRGDSRRLSPIAFPYRFRAPWLHFHTPEKGTPEPEMKLNIRKSTRKHAKKTGYRTRQKTAGGRKVNRRQRARHGSF